MKSEAPDASDWADTQVPGLFRFESHLQCPICRELLSRAPTITECGHTFCLECISRHIRSENKCPLCCHEIQQGKLRPNKIVDDLVETWTRTGLREKLLEVVSKPNFESLPSSRSPQRPLASEDSVVDQQIPEGYSACPVCGEVLHIDVIQGPHISKCLQQPQKRSRQTVLEAGKLSPRKKRAVFAKVPEEYPKVRLPVPSLYTMSEAKIKAKLKEAGLSQKGSKTQLTNRYVEWVTIWNASINERHPRTISELRKQITEWDKKQQESSNAPTDLKHLDGKKWVEANKESFDELVAQARSSVRKK